MKHLIRKAILGPMTASRILPFSRARLALLKNTSKPYSTPASYPKPSLVTISASLIGLGTVTAAFFHGQDVYAEAPHLAVGEASEKKGRKIRLEEVREHGRDAEAKWVTRGTRVYDITDWIPAHPGGDVILRGVGGAVDQYWDIFSIHKKQDVYDMLETYYIGEIDPRDLLDGVVPTEVIDNPFEADPRRDQRLHILTDRPFNAETPPAQLGSYITPNDTFFVRNHMWVPELDDSKHKLVVELYDGTQKEYTVADLKKFEQVKITATLQCSGNRRQHMSDEHRQTSGLPWKVGGISTAEFAGVRLRDILGDAGFPVDEWPNEVKHVQFTGAEAYGASIPIEKATDRRGDVLLAYQMNGEALPADHGYPLRVVVPGTVAARSVKWITKIGLSDQESTSQWQRRDYKCFGPNEGPNPDWDSARSIQETPVQSAITSFRDISAQTRSKSDHELLQTYHIEEDSVLVEGYCYSGGGRDIVRVDISADNGRNWHQAPLLPDTDSGAKSWAWKRWRWVVPKSNVGECFVVKAVDEAYNTQPETCGSIYNHRGNLTTAWHRVPYEPDRSWDSNRLYGPG